jgi:hypothetical protein
MFKRAGLAKAGPAFFFWRTFRRNMSPSPCRLRLSGHQRSYQAQTKKKERIVEMTWPDGRLNLVDGEWRWRGGAVAMVSASELLRVGVTSPELSPVPGTILQCGDYQVRILRESIPDFRLFVALNTWYAPLIVFWDKLRRTASLTKAFLIRLALIWGLGKYPGEGIRYDWDDIRFVHWMKRFFTR